jgi:dTDP-4-dehydrorhamnose reductase
MPKALVIGGSGQVGTALAARFGSDHDVVATGHSHTGTGQVALDLADGDAAAALVAAARPDVILLAAAMCHVDLCEERPELCRRINVEGPARIAEAARRVGARVVFFSSDHVFDGTRDTYTEDDAMHPLSVYASSKMEAELAIRDILPAAHVIVRTGWVYGPDPQRRNFMLRLVDRLQRGDTVAVPSDQVGCPTHTADLAEAAHFLLRSGAQGTFHATGPEAIDRVALSHRVGEHFGVSTTTVVPTPTAALAQTARRSLRVVLNCQKLASLGAAPFRDVSAGLDAMAQWNRSLDAVH